MYHVCLVFLLLLLFIDSLFMYLFYVNILWLHIFTINLSIFFCCCSCIFFLFLFFVVIFLFFAIRLITLEVFVQICDYTLNTCIHYIRYTYNAYSSAVDMYKYVHILITVHRMYDYLTCIFIFTLTNYYLPACLLACLFSCLF